MCSETKYGSSTDKAAPPGPKSKVGTARNALPFLLAAREKAKKQGMANSAAPVEDTYVFFECFVPEFVHPSQDSRGTQEIALEHAATYITGRRDKQEDRHVIVPDLKNTATKLKTSLDHLPSPLSLFAVLDGHQGHLA